MRILELHWRALVFALIVVVVLALYQPIFAVGFVNDDFIEVGARYFDAQDGLGQDDLGVWAERFVERALVDPVTDLAIFRPWRQMVFAADYFLWGLQPLGYHITNLLLYIFLCWVVVLLAWRLTRGARLAAALAGLLFAVQASHAIPVGSISSRGHLLAALFVALCVLFYVLPRTRRNLVMSWVMCALAIGSKETAWATPLLLLLYEVVYCRAELRQNLWGVVRRQAPFWALPLAVVGFRLLTTGAQGGGAFRLGEWDWVYQLEGYTLYAVRPFLLDIVEWQTALILGGLVVLGVLYRKRKQVVFGLLWVPLSLPLTIFFPPTERYFVTPSIGLALALAAILAQPLPELFRWANAARYAGAAVAAVLMIGFGLGAWNSNEDYLDLSNVTRRTLAQLHDAEPSLPKGATLAFVGLSAPARGGTLFIQVRHLEYALWMMYGDRSLRVEMGDNFPTTLKAPDQSYFFEYGNYQLTERADLVTALRNRKSCADAPDKTIRWEFGTDAQGWEPWSQIEGMQNAGGALEFRTTGTDAFMGSPFLRVPGDEIQNIKIEMRARAATPTFKGELYWQTAEMEDFSAEARSSFVVQADDLLHSYTIPRTVFGEGEITRLRFDPSDVPAEIQLESITIRCK